MPDSDTIDESNFVADLPQSEEDAADSRGGNLPPRSEDVVTQDLGLPPTDGEDQDDAPEMFPREVVEKLRHENGKYRQRAQQADTLAQRLHTELVRATGRLADPTDLEYVDEHLDDPDALAAAIDDLLDRKPHLATRRPIGDIGQGQRGSAAEPFSLLGLLKERT